MLTSITDGKEWPSEPTTCGGGQGVADVRGADIEIIERRKAPGEGADVVLPNHVRINGAPVAVPAGSLIQIGDISDGELVTVTITVFARSVSIRAEEP